MRTDVWKIIAAACAAGLAIVLGILITEPAQKPEPRVLNPRPPVAAAVTPPPAALAAPQPPAQPVPAAAAAPTPAAARPRRPRSPHAGMSEESKREMQMSYQRASRAFDVGDYDAAIAAYKDVYLLGGDVPMLYNIAQAYRLGKHPQQALMYYRRYLSRAPSAPNAADVRKKIAALEEETKTPPGVSTASR
jgi:hypothetical protein